MKFPFSFVLVVCLVALGSGCYTPRYVYSPSAQNIPVITKKGQSKLAALYSTNAGRNNDVLRFGKQKSNGVDIHSAYALSNRIIAQFNFYYRNEQNSNADENSVQELIKYNRNLIEVALGYYTSMNEGDKMYFYIFGSAGFGKFRFKDYAINGASLNYRNYYDASVFKWSVQPALLYKFNPQLSIALASRICFIDYRQIQTNYTYDQLDLYKLLEIEKGLASFWEPALVLNYRFKKLPYLQLEAQGGFAFLLNRKFVDSRTINLSAGIGVDLFQWFKSKPTPKK